LTAGTLLVGNRSAGTGLGEDLLHELARILAAELVLVANHVNGQQATKAWLATNPHDSVVIAAGGGGTLRAVVEGVLAHSEPARIGGLRLGSGNVIPRRYGIPRDPLTAARALRASIVAHRTQPCAVIRCEFGGQDTPRHGITMCGLGHFGRTSGDLVRFHARAGELRRAAARLIPLERLNDAEYLSSFLGRMAVAAVVPSSCELIRCRGRRFRLLAGVVLTTKNRADLRYHLVPRFGRPLSGRLQPGEQLSLELADRRQTEFFLDEDPELATGAIRITAAGTLDFVA
jgi:hypothetical protein